MMKCSTYVRGSVHKAARAIRRARKGGCSVGMRDLLEAAKHIGSARDAARRCKIALGDEGENIEAALLPVAGEVVRRCR
jgi:hypothetical protein